MNLNYYTLWIENEPEWLDSTIETVSNIVSEHGFVLQSDRCFSAEEFYQKNSANPHFLNKYDLILTDFHLGPGDDGNVLINKIRDDKRSPFTDIIFYGQDQEAISQRLNEHFIEGVYKSPRDIGLFSTKFEKVFESTIKKVQDISMMRGLVISAASELAIRVTKITQRYVEKLDPNAKSELRSYVLKIVKERIDGSSKKQVELNGLELHDLVSDHFFDDSQKVRILNKIYQQHKISNFKFSKDYTDEVISVRNDLGHCEESEKNGKKVLVTRKGEKTFTDEECVEVRKKLINHQQRLDIIESFIERM